MTYRSEKPSRAVVNARLKWAAALRSGKYKKGVGYLHIPKGRQHNKTDQFCCLGVAKSMFDGKTWDPNAAYICTAHIGDDAAAKFGISSVETFFSGLNDNGWSFARMATFIEKHAKASVDDLTNAAMAELDKLKERNDAAADKRQKALANAPTSA